MKNLAGLLLLPAVAFAANFTVNVGKNGATIEPSFVQADPGDQIFFDFYSGNHTITSSSFESPCTYSFDNDDFVGQYGNIDYGPAQSEQPHTRYILNVESTNPAWYHCAQTCSANHCKNGMVFAINPSDDQPFEQFLENARNSDTPPPGDCSWTTGTPTLTRTVTSAATSPTTSTITRESPTTTTSGSSGNGNNAGAPLKAGFIVTGGHFIFASIFYLLQVGV